LLAAAREYLARTNRRISFEYVLLQGRNDHQHQAIALARLLRRRSADDVLRLAHVNLIPWNPVPGEPLGRSERRRVLAFQQVLMRLRCQLHRARRARDVDRRCLRPACRHASEQATIPLSPGAAMIARSLPILLLLIGLLSSCGTSTSSTATPTPAVAVPAIDIPTPGGTLIMTLGARDPNTLDPALVGDVTSAFVVRQIFSGLVRLNDDLEVEPDLAEGWEVSDDGLTYTFTLREDARFADGRALTSADVQYSLERAADPDLAPFLPARTYLGDIVGVREKIDGQAQTISGIAISDDRTIAITIDAPKSYFLAKLAHPTSFIVDRNAVERGGNNWTDRPNGSGPFTIERWDHDQLLVLMRNLNFYRDLSRLDRVRFLIGAAASNPLVLYEQGRIDLVTVPGYALARVADENNPLSRELVSVPQLSLFYIGMNVRRSHPSTIRRCARHSPC
jgi:ABC-type transport system substrate-binding protein